MISKAGIQKLRESEHHDLVAAVVGADRIVDIVKEQKKVLKEKLEDAEYKARCANMGRDERMKELEEVRGKIAHIVTRIDTIIDVKFPAQNGVVVDDSNTFNELAQITPVGTDVPEELRILRMLRNDLEPIANNIPF